MRIAIIHDSTPATAGRPDISSQDSVVREVSAALVLAGREVRVIPVEGDIRDFLKKLKAFSPRCVFNLAESIAGDPGKEHLVPAVLEAAGFPYTGSGPESLSLSADKFISKSLMRSLGIPVPEFAAAKNPAEAKLCRIPFPVILKPMNEHGSAGIGEDSVIYSGEEELERLAEKITSEFKQPVIIERFIEGREINVSLLGNREYTVLPPSEIIFGGGARICGYAAKWLRGSDEYKNTTPECPAGIRDGVLRIILQTARAAAASHLCSGYARVDIRLNKAMEPFVIDVNPNPDLGSRSGLARSAEAAGLNYEALVEKIAGFALPED